MHPSTRENGEKMNSREDNLQAHSTFLQCKEISPVLGKVYGCIQTSEAVRYVALLFSMLSGCCFFDPQTATASCLQRKKCPCLCGHSLKTKLFLVAALSGWVWKCSFSTVLLYRQSSDLQHD